MEGWIFVQRIFKIFLKFFRNNSAMLQSNNTSEGLNLHTEVPGGARGFVLGPIGRLEEVPL